MAIDAVGREEVWICVWALRNRGLVGDVVVDDGGGGRRLNWRHGRCAEAMVEQLLLFRRATPLSLEAKVVGPSTVEMWKMGRYTLKGRKSGRRLDACDCRIGGFQDAPIAVTRELEQRFQDLMLGHDLACFLLRPASDTCLSKQSVA